MGHQPLESCGGANRWQIFRNQIPLKGILYRPGGSHEAQLFETPWWWHTVDEHMPFDTRQDRKGPWPVCPNNWLTTPQVSPFLDTSLMWYCVACVPIIGDFFPGHPGSLSIVTKYQLHLQNQARWSYHWLDGKNSRWHWKKSIWLTNLHRTDGENPDVSLNNNTFFYLE